MIASRQPSARRRLSCYSSARASRPHGPADRKTLAATAAVGCILLLLGGLMLRTTGSAHVVGIQYEGEIPRASPGRLLAKSAWHRLGCPMRPGSTNSCTFTIGLPEGLRSAPHVSLHYVVDPFFQNYPTYLESTVWKELAGAVVSTGERERRCRRGTRLTETGQEVYPCGLRATSLFNDTFEVLHPGTLEPLPLDQSSLAWQSDLRRFANPAGYPADPSFSWLPDRYPSVVPAAEGVRSELFASWMRPSAMPRVAKPYGRFRANAVGLEGNITIRINASFPVEGIDASKQLLLSTHTAFGGASDDLSIFLMGAGGLCLAASLVVVSIQLCCAREPGEPRSRARRTADADFGSASGEESDGTSSSVSSELVL